MALFYDTTKVTTYQEKFARLCREAKLLAVAENRYSFSRKIALKHITNMIP